ncbi:MAG: tetratricopeptide repeat protein [Legionella sp.]
MKRLITTLLIFNSFSVAAFTWQDLWLTPNQQAQQLMQKGQFAQAKDVFDNQDWAASAAYRAGEYESAADQFKQSRSQAGYYNQGNALAHMGKYEQAIKAYDKALALNPQDQDAIFNRKLVQDLMKKDKNKQKNKDQQNKDQQDKDQQDKDQQDKDQQNKDQQNKDQQNKDQQNKDQQNKDQQNKDQQNKDQQNKDKPEQAKQEKDKKDKQKDANAAQSPADKEKQQAKEQWLKLIPDDPGGLLREKFLRDHLRRERGWYE